MSIHLDDQYPPHKETNQFTEENIVEIKKEDVPKRKRDDLHDDWAPSLEEENNIKADNDDDWKRLRSNRKKKNIHNNPEPVAPSSVSVLDESVIIKTEPGVIFMDVLEESIVKKELIASVIINVLDESATKKSYERRQGRGRPKKSIASMKDTSHKIKSEINFIESLDENVRNTLNTSKIYKNDKLKTNKNMNRPIVIIKLKDYDFKTKKHTILNGHN